jgi:hypothetical protein
VCDTREYPLSTPSTRFEDNGDGTVSVWEGNTRPGTSASDSGGGEGVYLRVRPKSQIQSYRRVRG